MKKLETEELLEKVQEISMVNGGLEEHIRKHDIKNQKLKKRIDDLKVTMST